MTALVNHVIILVKTVRTMLLAFFEVNNSKLPSRFQPASTARTTMVNDMGPMGLSESA